MVAIKNITVYLIHEIKRRVKNYIVRFNLISSYPSSVKLGHPIRIRGNVIIGEGTTINSYSHLITGKKSKIIIGRGCAISFNVHIRAQTRNPYNIKETIEKDIIIGDDVLIGANVFIREGINVGSHSVIGVNSVVTHDVLEHHVVGGIPARTLYVKNKEHQHK